MIREFHLFAGIGGGIYGGRLLGHRCVAGVEIDTFCQKVLHQRQADGWLDNFDIYGDLLKLNGEQFRGQFDVLCGGFPCQAFSTAPHGNNIPEKNLWDEMLRFTLESEAPVVFAENVTLKAIDKAQSDLEDIGYKVKICKLSCENLGADHKRNRFWLLAIKDGMVYYQLVKKLVNQPKLKADNWTNSINNFTYPSGEMQIRKQLKAIGNAQSPFVAASAFRILVNRHILGIPNDNVNVSANEINEVFEVQQTWIQRKYGIENMRVHTPTTIANYLTPSMQKHQGCRNYKEIFGRLIPLDAEYLMGFPIGASAPFAVNQVIPQPWVAVNAVDGE